MVTPTHQTPKRSKRSRHLARFGVTRLVIRGPEPVSATDRVFDGDRRPPPSSLRDALDGGASRRRFAELLLSTGFGAAAVRWLAPEDFLAAPSDEVPIVYAVARSDPDDPTSLEPRTKTVPRDWHAGLTRAFETRERRLGGDLSGLVGAFVRPGSYDGRGPATAVHVDVGERELADRLASSVHEVELSISHLTDLPPRPDPPESADVAFARDADDSAIPGGVACGDGDSLATLAPAMYDADSGDPFFATPNHLYGDQATLRTAHRGRDLAAYGEHEADSLGRTVAGQPTRLGLADLQARGEPLSKVGAVSGLPTGRIEGVDGVTCYTGDICKGGQLKWGSEDVVTDGDSGSVPSRVDPERPEERVFVAGFNDARTWWPGGSYTRGPPPTTPTTGTASRSERPTAGPNVGTLSRAPVPPAVARPDDSPRQRSERRPGGVHETVGRARRPVRKRRLYRLDPRARRDGEQRRDGERPPCPRPERPRRRRREARVPREVVPLVGPDEAERPRRGETAARRHDRRGDQPREEERDDRVPDAGVGVPSVRRPVRRLL